MSEVKNDGGPAFPQERISHVEALSAGPSAPAHAVPHYVHDGGMSMRDWFAGHALAGMASNSRIPDAFQSDVIAMMAFRIADAMIAERSK